jgi:hypothetical protein
MTGAVAVGGGVGAVGGGVGAVGGGVGAVGGGVGAVGGGGVAAAVGAVEVLVLTAVPEQAAMSCTMATRAPDLDHCVLRMDLEPPETDLSRSKRLGPPQHV